MAAEYAAPIADIRFVLEDVVGLQGLAALDGLDSLTSDFVAQVLDEAGRFAAGVLAPLNRPGDEQGARLENGAVRMPDGFREAYAQWVEAGWGAANADPRWGGMGLGDALSGALAEMWQAANMSFADGLMLTQGAVEAIDAHGDEAMKAIYLPKLVTGEWSGTMNLTEPGAGSDVGALTTRALPGGNGAWRLVGTKIFITHADHDMSENVVHMVLARTPGSPPGTKGISLFVAPKFMPGENGALGRRNDLRVVSLEHKMGHMASPTAVLSYGDNGGADAALIGGERNGMRCMFTMMNSARLNVAIQGLAIAERASQAALDWARQRIQGAEIGGAPGRPVAIVRHPDVRRMLMDMRAQTEAMRALCYAIGAALDHARRGGDESAAAFADLMIPVAKAWCTDRGFAVASTGVQVHGGMGYIEETGAAQHLRDARIAMIYEGTNGIQALDLVRRKLQQDDGRAAAALIADMRETARALADAGLGDIAAALAPAVDALERATNWIRAAWRGDPVAAAAGATVYADMAGFIAGGWMLGKAAMKARMRLEAGAEDTGFYEAKIATARFYASQRLAPAAALETPVTTARESTMAIPEDRL